MNVEQGKLFKCPHNKKRRGEKRILFEEVVLKHFFLFLKRPASSSPDPGASQSNS
jgi:hypothetical protein